MQLDAAWIQILQKPETWVRVLVPTLVLMSLYLGARAFWVVVDMSTADYRIDQVAGPVVSAGASSAVGTVSIAAIANKHLFGDVAALPDEPAVVEEVAAAETQLPLKLRGIYASNDDARASAIIESGGGKQAVYFLGEAIEGARGAVLHQVRPNQVLLSRSGQLESLTLEQEDSAFIVEQESLTTDQSDDESPEPMEMVDNPRITRELNELRDQLQADPTSLQEMIRWEPVMENGMITGVKIAPGKARRLFNQLKLRRNDIVTTINGIPLNDPSQLLMLRDMLSTADEVSLTLLRNGEEQSISISLAEDAQ